MSEASFTWNPQWNHPYESLYSLLRKFALANVSTVRELQRTFSVGIKREKLQNWSNGDRDLYGFGALNPLALAQAFRMSAEAMHTTVAISYLRGQETKALTSLQWRICPACITEGFHATLYQLAFVATCPYHKVSLITSCPDCNAQLPLYLLTKESFTSTFGCHGCGKSWWQPEKPFVPNADVSNERTALLRVAHDWLTRRRQLPTVEPDLWRLTRFGYDARGLSENVRSLPHRWADLMGCPVPQHFSTERIPVAHLKLPIVRLGLSNQLGLDDTGATQIYRTFRRHLERSILKHHRHCIRSVGKRLWWNAVHREVEVTGICHYAYAYLLWRMFWEQIEVPQQLFSRQRRLWHQNPRISCDWLPPELPVVAASRLFALECLQSYHRCLHIARKMHGEGRLLFPVWQVAAGRKVEWTLENKTETGCTWLHWWWRADYPFLGVAPKHLDQSFNKTSSELYCIAC